MRFEVRTDVPGDEPYAVVGSDGPVGWYVTRDAAEAAAVAADANAPADWNGWPQLAAVVAAAPATFHLPGVHDQKTHGRRGATPKLGNLIKPGRGVDPYDVAQEIFGGEFAGLHVSVAQLELGDGEEDPIHLIGGVVEDGKGKQVGDWTATIIAEPGERPYLEDPGLRLKSTVQGSGFSLEWLAQMFAWARDNDFSHAQIWANEDVGGYAWAVQGWDWADGEESRPFIEDFLARARRRDLSEEEEDQLGQLEEALKLDAKDPGFPTPRQLASIGRQPGQGGKSARWLGKDLLLGTKWRAALRFEQ